jgi:shikimate dehydrogenase
LSRREREDEDEDEREVEVEVEEVVPGVDAERPAPAAAGRAPGRLGVLGWPVAHSRSPAMHRAAFASLGLSGWSYQLLPVPPELFAETVRALPAAGFVGANVTVPHKQAALALADSASARAREIGAANTLSFGADGTIAAENTDAPALIAALGIELAGRSAVVLGAGGTARSAVWALREAGVSVAVWNRTPARARELASAFGVRALELVEPADLLLNCTTVGLEGQTDDSTMSLQSLGLNTDLLSSYALVVEYVYGRDQTRLLKTAGDLGVKTVDGLTILAEQGALSFELWTGHVAPRALMSHAAAQEL